MPNSSYGKYLNSLLENFLKMKTNNIEIKDLVVFSPKIFNDKKDTSMRVTTKNFTLSVFNNIDFCSRQ